MRLSWGCDNFENLKCSVCKIENESQKHIIECNEIRKLRGNSFKSVEYENLFGENVKKQLDIMKYLRIWKGSQQWKKKTR